MMEFEIVGQIMEVQVIEIGSSIREIDRLRKIYDFYGRWRKLKGVANIRLPGGIMRKAEVHWYEAHGIGKKKIKIKRFLD
jgi:hypothetical protein